MRSSPIRHSSSQPTSPSRKAHPVINSAAVLALVAGLAWGLPSAHAQPAANPAAPPTPVAPPAGSMAERTFTVSGFVVGYSPLVRQHPNLPSIPELMGITSFELVPAARGYLVPRPGTRGATITMNELSGSLYKEGGKQFTRAAIEAVMAGISRALNERGIVGVWVELSPADIQVVGPDWTDLRPADRSTITMTINVATVSAVRTVASDGQIDPAPLDRVKSRSPVQGPAAAGDSGDLISRQKIEEYVAGLNRHPGRRVDVAVGAGEEPGTAVVDYLVQQERPWMLYFQLSNTGTKSTQQWRERLGFVHNQLTNNDDILSLDYITAGFDKSHAVNGSYELPLGFVDKLRLKLSAGYNEFDASEVGAFNERFKGSGYNVGGDLIYQLAQWGPSFLDLTGGFRYQHIEIDNQAVLVSGEDSFFLPRFGLNYQRYTPTASSTANIAVEFNVPGAAGTNDNLDPLGRTGAKPEFATFQWNFDQSFYLEPLIDKARFNAGQSTLAHEIGLGFRGQTSFGTRLVPNFQQVAGGFYSVRGYQESEAAGDTAVIFSAEYRLHIPRLLAVSDQVEDFFGPFRVRPGANYARPDWDLIFRTFLDVARTINADRLNFERDETLASTGLGFELQIRRNVNLRVDWGIALKETRATNTGDSRLHFLATILF
jgi:hemolysin activation/secretion protein